MQLQRDIVESERESLRDALARVCAPVHIVLASVLTHTAWSTTRAPGHHLCTPASLLTTCPPNPSGHIF